MSRHSSRTGTYYFPGLHAVVLSIRVGTTNALENLFSWDFTSTGSRNKLR